MTDVLSEGVLSSLGGFSLADYRTWTNYDHRTGCYETLLFCDAGCGAFMTIEDSWMSLADVIASAEAHHREYHQ